MDLYVIFNQDVVCIRPVSDLPGGPEWEGPFRVLLTNHVAFGKKEASLWIHRCRAKKAPCLSGLLP